MSQGRLDASRDLDLLPPLEVVRTIQREDAKVAAAVAAVAEPLAAAAAEIARRLAGGGRLFYVGAGTSGRIAMLDAAELPPTYGTDPELVQVIMAGGAEAFTGAVEGAEDDETAAVREVERRVGAGDAVVGIAASGTTPFTRAALRRAGELGAFTVGVTSTPGSPLAREPATSLVVDTGPEVIMGSTRMKSGTAQKLVLNTLSTTVMVLLGRVYSNLMIEMPATNRKLQRRAVEMVRLAAGVDEDTARRALERSGGEVKTAAVVAVRDVDAEAARRLLGEHGGRLRSVLGEAP